MINCPEIAGKHDTNLLGHIYIKSNIILGDFDTNVAAAQLNLLFDMKSICRRRGREVVSYENIDDLLFDPTPIDAFDKYYEPLHSASFRQIIGMIVNKEKGINSTNLQENCKKLNSKQIEDIINRALKLEFILEKDSKCYPCKPVNFGPTSEWYTAAVCVNELSSMACWGVKVKGLPGDYDVVLFRENQIGYIECKSGRLSNIEKSHIKNFLERERALTPQFSIYLVDGISRDSINTLVDYALEQKLEYAYEMLGVMDKDVTLEAEEYNNFVRLTPINSFFVSVRDALKSTLNEVYEFLTLGCDRPLPTENVAAKQKFM
jgi:hypothetical protein